MVAVTSPAAIALPGSAALASGQIQDRDELVSTVHAREGASNRFRLFNRTPTSPYYSAGYPRLYYYPWGLRPVQRRWHR